MASPELLLFHVLVQLTVIVAVARIGGNLSVRWGNARAVGEIAAGLLLGPSLFGLIWPEGFGWVFRTSPSEPLTILSQIGLILLLFQIGMEFDFGHLRSPRHRRGVVCVALAGEVLPFALGFGFGQLSAPVLFAHGNAWLYSLFCGTALAITALPILGRIMVELDLQRTPVGVISISAAAIDDVVGWLLLAVVSALTLAQFSLAGFGMRLLFLALYLSVCVVLVRPLLLRFISRYPPDRHGVRFDLLAIVLCAILLSAMATSMIGIFAIFGGFMLGVLLHDQHELRQAWRKQVDPLVAVFFLPVFFTYTGLRTDIGLLHGWEMWGWLILIVALATLGKFGGCYAAARLAGLEHRPALAVGIMMDTRALMELVVINVGYDLGVLPQSVFTMLVLMAIVSTVVTTPVLRRVLRPRPIAAANADA